MSTTTAGRSQKSEVSGQRREQSARIMRVALLGCGTVGREVARLLIEDRQRIAERSGIDFRLRRILVRDRNRDRGIDPALFTDLFDQILRADVDIVIEALGGLDPAASYVRSLLTSGIHVITANKTLVAHHGQEFEQLAAGNGVTCSYEASVCAAVPVIAALKRLAGDQICSITGIVNGSCNFILSRMTQDSISLDDAAIEARELGLVEPDPSADLSGRDGAEKLAVLCSVAGFGRLAPSQISTRGIENITREDIRAAKRRGCVVKLIASARIEGDRIIAEVGPAFVPRSHPLASVEFQHNALLIESELGGELLLQGKGAGPRPTAAAILGDLLHVAGQGVVHPVHRVVQTAEAHQPLYVRFNGNQRNPHHVFETLAKNDVPVAEIDFEQEQITLLAEAAKSKQVELAAAELSADRNCRPFIAAHLRNGRSHATLIRRGSAVKAAV